MVDPLTLPTDRVLLELMIDGTRQTPKNVAAILDQDRSYMSGRLRFLEDERGYLQDPGPADRSGMYEITDLGKIAANHVSKYVREYDEIFDELVKRVYEQQPDDEFLPDLLVMNEEEYNVLQLLQEHDGLTLHSDVATLATQGEFDLDLSGDVASQMLYRLYFHCLLDRKEGMDVYQMNTRGRIVASHEKEVVLGDRVGFTKQLRDAENIL